MENNNNDTSSSSRSTGSAAVKIVYSSPASPSPTIASDNTSTPHSSRVVGSIASNYSPGTAPPSVLSTPKKNFLDAVMLQTIRKKLATPGAFELQSLRLDCSMDSAVNVVKDKYLICAKPKHMTADGFSKGQSCYRHLVDMNMSNLKCTDIFTGEQFLCKVINEPFIKVQQAYFKLQQETDNCRSSIFGHQLIRGVRDIVPLNKQRTYIILAPAQTQSSSPSEGAGIYEDLHTYLREKHRLCESEARSLFHQICETVLICHRNGIILRDLKLKRFFFVDEAR